MRVFVFVSFIAVVLQVTMANKRYGAPVYVAAPAEADNDSGNDEYTRDCHGEGGCVYESNCLECGDNEVYSCSNPRLGCTDSCDHRVKNAASCSAQKGTNCPCMECKCREGYARDSTYQCVPLSKCPVNIKCGENEYYSTCISRCYTDSCDAKDLAARNDICKEFCGLEGGCQCEVDYARHPITNKCILKKDCPAGCPANEIAVSCKICQPSDSCADSANPNKKVPAICKTLPPADCQSGCNCKKDYYRSPYAFNQCVPLCDCPKPIKSTSNGSDGNGSPPAPTPLAGPPPASSIVSPSNAGIGAPVPPPAFATFSNNAAPGFAAPAPKRKPV